jgi:uncharacterized protein (DUF2252 family)
VSLQDARWIHGEVTRRAARRSFTVVVSTTGAPEPGRLDAQACCGPHPSGMTRQSTAVPDARHAGQRGFVAFECLVRLIGTDGRAEHMTGTTIAHPGLDERRARGREARIRIAPSGHAGWEPAAGRPNPVALLEEQNATRDADLVPVRHGRMLVSPFTFYRGAAKIMAADLKDTPTAGLTVQLCGDAHLSNFGVFASPERALLFDLNDFDETLPGPFEYDVKRLAASFAIAARNNAFSKGDTRAVTLAVTAAYREAMGGFAEMPTMEVWYSHMAEDALLKVVGAAGKKGGKPSRQLKGTRKILAKAHTRDSMQASAKLAEVVDGRHRIVSDPPIVVPARDLAVTYGFSPDEVSVLIHEQFRAYRATLQDDRRHLLERFEVVDMARKVVGVGSVGTRAFIILLQGRNAQDPLFLQIKEATSSVLEDYLPKSRYRQHGARVVHGQRMMQAASDIYLGWTRGVDVERHFYWRQLRDMKGSVDPELTLPAGLLLYAQLCGWTLARAHARSGDPVAIAAYLGRSDKFDRSITDFSERYADQNDLDFTEFTKAVRSGRLEATEGI